MTGIRTSVIWKPEQKFGKADTSKELKWHRFPAAATFSYDSSNNPSYTNGIGTKFYELVTGGRFTGTWTADFKLDYNNIDILGAMFEDYSFEGGIHKFSKVDGKRVPSMTFRVKKLNRIVGGGEDQTVILLGCVCTSINFNQSSGAATIDCSMSGVYVDEMYSDAELDSTDYDGYYGTALEPVEWACMKIGNDRVCLTESSGITITNGVSTLPGCGTRIDQGYMEGKTSVSVRTTVYSNNPKNYYRRMYSGGIDNAQTKPLRRGLKPIEKMSLESEDETSGKFCKFVMKNVFVEKSGQGRFGDSKIVDSPGLKASKCSLEIKNGSDKAIDTWVPVVSVENKE